MSFAGRRIASSGLNSSVVSCKLQCRNAALMKGSSQSFIPGMPWDP